jgi:nucleoside-diphosphate-sugar epimerase
MNHYSSSQIINIGTGFDYSIKELVKILQEEIGTKGKIKWDRTKPDGTFEKKTDISRLKTIYPEFNPRSFQRGLREILDNKKEVKRILKN